MEGKVDKTIVKSIIAAWWINLAICIFIVWLIFVGIYIYNKGKDKAEEDKQAEIRANCLNQGLCYYNNGCHSCIGAY